MLPTPAGKPAERQSVVSRLSTRCARRVVRRGMRRGANRNRPGLTSSGSIGHSAKTLARTEAFKRRVEGSTDSRVVVLKLGEAFKIP